MLLKNTSLQKKYIYIYFTSTKCIVITVFVKISVIIEYYKRNTFDSIYIIFYNIRLLNNLNGLNDKCKNIY